MINRTVSTAKAFSKATLSMANWSYYLTFMVVTIAWARVLFTPGFIMHGDLAYPIKLATLGYNYFPIWDQHPSISNFDELDRVLIMVPALWAAQILHLDVGVFSRLFSYLVSLIGALGIVFCKRTLESILKPSWRPNPGFAMLSDLCAVVIFTFNPWALYQVEAPFFQMAYAFLPWFVAAQLRFLLFGGLGWLLVAVATWTLASGSPQYTLFTGAFSLALFWIARGYVSNVNLRTMAARYLVILASYVLINLHWIGAFFAINSIKTLTPGYVLRWEDVQLFSQQSTFYNVVTGLDVWVTWWRNFNPWANGPVEWVAIVARLTPLVTASICCVLLWRDRFMRASFAAIVVLIVVLQGAHGPFHLLYKYLVFNVVPGYGWIIRTPEKFGAYLWFLYAAVIGVGLTLLASRFPLRRVTIAVYCVLIFSVIGMLPVIRGTLYLHYVPVASPRAYLQSWDYLKHKQSKILVLADFENLGRYNSGDAIFKWAPKNMAGSTVSRSMPIPTFGVYHFTNPFAAFYSQIKSAGPSALPGFASMLSTRYVMIENDVVGDDAWASKWRKGLLAAHCLLRLQTPNYSLFEVPNVESFEARYGPYAMLEGDGEAISILAKRFGSQAGRRLFLTAEQSLARGAFSRLLHASALVLYHRSIKDAVLASYRPDDYIRLQVTDPTAHVFSTWVSERTSYRYEENGGFWGPWAKQVLQIQNTRPYDFGLGVILTAAPGARFNFRIPSRAKPTDIYVRYLSSDGRETPAFTMIIDGVKYAISATSRVPTWRWKRVATLQAGAAIPGTFVATAGAPAINTVLLSPVGETKRRISKLLATKSLKIYNLTSLRSLNGIPLSASIPATTFPYNVTATAKGALALSESYDPYWFATSDGRRVSPTYAWGYAPVFAPLSGATTLTFVPQASLDKWMRIELYGLLSVIACYIGYLVFYGKRKLNEIA